MARPSTTDDVTDTRVQLATFQFDEFATEPSLLKAYADFLDAAEYVYDSMPERNYGTVVLHRQKTTDELETALKSAQSTWDYRKKAYDRAVEQGSDGLKDYEIQSVKHFAKAEGLTDPFEG